MRIKKNDHVKVITGADKGKKGKVIAVDAEKGRVTVEGVNIVSRHKKESQGANGQKVPGGVIKFEAPIDVSNVQLIVKHEGKEVVTRVRYERKQVTKKRSDNSEYDSTRAVRISTKTGKEI